MKLIGVDYGRRRIGLAVSDESGSHVRGLPTIDRKKHSRPLAPLCLVIANEHAKGIVMGLPLDSNELETAMSAEVKLFAEGLRKETNLKVFFIDESLSSKEATELLRFRRKKERRDKGAIDRIAACLILEAFLKEHPPDAPLIPSPPDSLSPEERS